MQNSPDSNGSPNQAQTFDEREEREQKREQKMKYQQELQKTIFGSADQKSLLKYRKRVSRYNKENSHPNSVNGSKAKPSKSKKKILEPIKILDAPGLEDDFYLNLLDWNSENYVGIALKNDIYIQNVSSGEIALLESSRGENGADTTSLAWSKEDCNPYLSQGLRTSEI